MDDFTESLMVGYVPENLAFDLGRQVIRDGNWYSVFLDFESLKITRRRFNRIWIFQGALLLQELPNRTVEVIREHVDPHEVLDSSTSESSWGPTTEVPWGSL